MVGWVRFGIKFLVFNRVNEYLKISLFLLDFIYNDLNQL